MIAALRNRWYTLSARDQRVLGIGAAIAAALLLWVAVWQPLSASIAAHEKTLNRLNTELAAMRLDAQAIASLQSQGRVSAPTTSPPTAAEVQRALGNSVEWTQLDARQFRLKATGLHARKLFDWLVATRRATGLTPVEASVIAQDGGRVQASVVLANP